jgi:hypothetical protein
LVGRITSGSTSQRLKSSMIPSTQSIPFATLSPHIYQATTGHCPLHLVESDKPRFSGRCKGSTITPFNVGHTLGGTIWKIRSPAVGTVVYAVNMNNMRERHLDGTVLISGAGGTVLELLARPDLLITDAERANVIGSRRKDRDAALISVASPSPRPRFPALAHDIFRYHHCNTFVTVLFASSLRRKHARPRITRIA